MFVVNFKDLYWVVFHPFRHTYRLIGIFFIKNTFLSSRNPKKYISIKRENNCFLQSLYFLYTIVLMWEGKTTVSCTLKNLPAFAKIMFGKAVLGNWWVGVVGCNHWCEQPVSSGSSLELLSHYSKPLLLNSWFPGSWQTLLCLRRLNTKTR